MTTKAHACPVCNYVPLRQPTPAGDVAAMRLEAERDIRIAIWNAGKWQGKADEVAQSLIRKAMDEPAMQRALDRIAALSASPQPVAESHVVVPRVPSEAMIEAGWFVISCDHPFQSDMPRGTEVEVWSAMIAASSHVSEKGL